jgi:hypothetical protein
MCRTVFIPFLLIVATTFCEQPFLRLHVDSGDLDLSTVCRSGSVANKNKSLGPARRKKTPGGGRSKKTAILGVLPTTNCCAPFCQRNINPISPFCQRNINPISPFCQRNINLISPYCRMQLRKSFDPKRLVFFPFVFCGNKVSENGDFLSCLNCGTARCALGGGRVWRIGRVVQHAYFIIIYL